MVHIHACTRIRSTSFASRATCLPVGHLPAYKPAGERLINYGNIETSPRVMMQHRSLCAGDPGVSVTLASLITVRPVVRKREEKEEEEEGLMKRGRTKRWGSRR